MVVRWRGGDSHRAHAGHPPTPIHLIVAVGCSAWLHRSMAGTQMWTPRSTNERECTKDSAHATSAAPHRGASSSHAATYRALSARASPMVSSSCSASSSSSLQYSHGRGTRAGSAATHASMAPPSRSSSSRAAMCAPHRASSPAPSDVMAAVRGTASSTSPGAEAAVATSPAPRPSPSCRRAPRRRGGPPPAAAPPTPPGWCQLPLLLPVLLRLLLLVRRAERTRAAAVPVAAAAAGQLASHHRGCAPHPPVPSGKAPRRSAPAPLR